MHLKNVGLRRAWFAHRRYLQNLPLFADWQDVTPKQQGKGKDPLVEQCHQ